MPPETPSKKQPRFTPVPDTTFKVRLTGFLLAWIIRLYCLLLRIRIEDKAGLDALSGAVIWAYWHNRLFTLPLVYRRSAKHRSLFGLASASKDGAIISAIMKRFGMGCVRGSSSKRAAQALVECRRRLLDGSDLGITPDGPRGPVYVAAPGVVQLSRLTGRPVMPVQVTYSRKWQLKSWDRFQIPKPFSRVTVTVLPPMQCGAGSIEEECLKLQQLLGTEPQA